MQHHKQEQQPITQTIVTKTTAGARAAIQHQ